MAEISAAFVTLAPSFQGFGRKMDSGISPAAMAAGTKAGKVFGGAMGSAIKLGGALAVGSAAVGLLKGSLDEAREAQKVGAQTNAVIKSTGGVAGVTAGQVGKLATAISNKSGIDDEAIASGENLLLTFTNVRNEAGKGNDVFNQTTKAATDMSVALGTSLTGASMQLGKALNDPIKGVTKLQRSGVTFTDQQKAQITTLVKSGKTLQAQKVILGEVNREFGGSAKAAATAGDKFKVAFGNLEESVGTAILPVIDKVLGGLTKFAIKVGPAIGPAFAKIGGFVGPVLQKLRGFAGDAVDVFKGIGTRISGAFTGISLSYVGTQLAKQAKGWATPIIAGFKAGLNTGDWSGLGQAVGNGVVRAVTGLGQLAGRLGTVLGGLLAKIDWVGIGIAIGKQAPSLLVGLAAGLLNFDLLGLLKGLANHWQDVLLAVVAVAFTPAKIVGKVGEALARIPLAGRLLQWALVHFKTFSDGLVGMAGRALSFLGSSFLTGFRRVFPVVGKAFAEALTVLPTRVGLIGIELRARAARMLQGLVTGITSGIGAVVAKIGELIARMLRPFAAAGTWLVRGGLAAVRGLGRGIASGIGAVVSIARSILGRILGAIAPLGGKLAGSASRALQAFIAREKAGISTIVSTAAGIIGKVIGAISGLAGKLGSAAAAAFAAFLNREKAGIGNVVGAAKGIGGRIVGAVGNLGGLLTGAGRAVIQGLISGVESMIGSLKAKLHSITSLIPKHKGPPSKDRTLLFSAGKSIMKGLLDGLDDGTDEVTGTLDRLTSKIQHFYDHKFKSDKKSAAASKTALKGLRDEYKAILANAKAHDVAKASLDAANQAGADIASSAKDYGSLTNIEGADILDVDGKATGEKAAVTAADIAAGLKTRLAAITNFSNQLAGLRAKGLGDAAIQTIAAAGVESGAAYANALTAATPDQIKAINSAQQQIVGASTAVGTNAVAGLVAGLTNDLAAVDAAGATIADRLRDAIRAQLGLKGRGSDGGKKSGKKDAPNKGALKQIATRSARLSAATVGTTGAGATNGRSAPLIGNAVIRETVDLDKYSRQQAFRERMFNLGG